VRTPPNGGTDGPADADPDEAPHFVPSAHETARKVLQDYNCGMAPETAKLPNTMDNNGSK